MTGPFPSDPRRLSRSPTALTIRAAKTLLWLVGKFWSRTRRARDFGEREPSNHSMAWWCELAVAAAATLVRLDFLKTPA